jgi:benzoyl-CoA reductase/2-hydroxyglutaryl-CoA dehydratase subunit BcrC/BadD/HgdB
MSLDKPGEIPEILQRMLVRNEQVGVDPSSLQGTLMRGVHFAQLLYHAFASGKPVTWVNVFTPLELIFACDCVPFWMDGAGGFSGWIEMSEAFEKADALLPSRDTCTFLRAAIGGVATGLFPQPDAVICTSHLCETAPKIAQMIARYHNVDYHVIDVPGKMDEKAIAYVATQLEQLAHRLCQLSRTEFDIEKFRAAVALTNKASRHFAYVAEMRKHVPAYVPGSQFVGLGLVYPWGSEDGAMIAETFAEEVSRRVAGNILAVEGGEKSRLMWIHLRPVFETDIMNHIEQTLRAVIVVDVLGEIWWPELDERDPFRALAVRLLSNPELLPLEKKIRRLIHLADEYAVDGVVHFLHWGCRWNYGQSAIFKEALAKAHLPFLALDGDAVDKRATPYGQMVTRLEAFLELLETNGSRRRAR